MAPEQLESREADARTDIFAFGAVLYEMVTGTKPFEAKTATALMAAILDVFVPVSTRKPIVSPALDHLVGKCLSEDSDGRWQTAHDLMLELKWVTESGRESRGSGRGLSTSSGCKLGCGGRAGPDNAVCGRSAAATVERHPCRRGAHCVSNSAAAWHCGRPSGSLARWPIDCLCGRRRRRVREIYVRQRDSIATRQLPGTQGASSLFWSPDSRFLGFAAQNKMKKIAISGGPAQALCDAGGGTITGGTWNAEGTIVFSTNGPLRRVSAAGGEPIAITTVPGAHDMYWWPSFLPDGRHFLFSVRSERAAENGVYVGSLDSHSIKLIVKADLRALFFSPADLLFVRARTLLAQPFDMTRLEVTGEPVVVAAPVGYLWTGFDAAFSVSPTGVVAYESADYPVADFSLVRSRGPQTRTRGRCRRLFESMARP